MIESSDGPRSALRPGRGNRAELRPRNRQLLLHLIQTGGPLSQAELARKSFLSPATVSAILQPLLNKRLLVEVGKSTIGMGRKGSMISFNPHAGLAVGVVIEQDEYEVALVTLSGQVIDRVAGVYRPYTEVDEIVPCVADGLGLLLQRSGFTSGELVGAGVAVPGLIDPEKGVVRAAANLRWRNVALRSLLEESIGVPVKIERLVRAKLLAEALWGCGVGHSNFIFLEIGSGIAAGIMLDGHILKGATSSAGEIGHSLFDVDGPPCACGLNGCWEVFCSRSAICRSLAAHIAAASGHRSVLGVGSSLADLSLAAQQNDPVAYEVIREAAGYLARGLVNLIWSFDPELIVVSGSVIRQCPAMIEATQQAIRTTNAARNMDIPLVAASQGAKAGVIAASSIVSVPYLESLACDISLSESVKVTQGSSPEAGGAASYILT